MSLPFYRNSGSSEISLHSSIKRRGLLQPLVEHATIDDARKVLATKATVVLGQGTTASDEKMVKKANIKCIIFPWMPVYRVWWSTTAMGAILSAFFGPFLIAFQNEPGTFSDAAALVDLLLNLLFTVDILVNFNLALYKDEVMVFGRREIFKAYFTCMFWVDLIGVFPFETVALLMAGDLGKDNSKALLLSLFQLLRFVRLHRLKRLSYILQYNARISLLWFTIIRNLAAVLFITHLAACSMYYLARLHGFGEDTWLGPLLVNHVMGSFDRYVSSLYWAVVTFCTVGYGDFSPVNSAEQICGIFFMIVNIVVAAWIIGSITLLVVKGDEKTGEYRDTLQTLHQYSEMHGFDDHFSAGLKTQLRLEFNNREIADEQVLKNFPSAVRRKILRKLYLAPLTKTTLMKGIRQQFVDAFLASCKVEIFSPGEVIVERGSILSDLFLLVGGIAEITTSFVGRTDLMVHTSDDFDDFDADEHLKHRQLEAGEFVGEIGFFTKSPQVDSVACLTVCKTLTMSQSAFKILAQDHPTSVGKLLKNLLARVQEMERLLPKNISLLRAGSEFDVEQGYGSLLEADDELREEIARKQEELTAIKDLVEMHMSRQLDDLTTRFCFAASRGDTSVISLMCSQGFDANSADYDSRTALMVASMKGNTDVCKMLLEYKADPNLTDMHGSTALLEAVKHGHEDTMNLLFEYEAELCMSESLAASVLCQAVFDGDILLLKRLLRAGIQVNAADYDKRTAAHIAAAEGNVAAIRLLAENNADLTVEDRWKNTVQREAERSNVRQLLEFLNKSSL